MKRDLVASTRSDAPAAWPATPAVNSWCITSATSAERQLLTVGEVGDELGIARSTFYDWKAKGRVPRCFKLPNGDLRIRRADFDEWFASLEVEAA